MEEVKGKPSKESKVTLREITEDTVRTICKLSMTEKQNSYVASNAVTIAQSYFNKQA